MVSVLLQHEDFFLCTLFLVILRGCGLFSTWCVLGISSDSYIKSVLGLVLLVSAHLLSTTSLCNVMVCCVHGLMIYKHQYLIFPFGSQFLCLLTDYLTILCYISEILCDTFCVQYVVDTNLQVIVREADLYFQKWPRLSCQ